jgi:hypothetical protein
MTTRVLDEEKKRITKRIARGEEENNRKNSEINGDRFID